MNKNIYLILSVLGLILPMTQFAPWSTANGFDLAKMFADMFANGIASGIAIDALIAGVVIILFIIVEAKRLKVQYAWVSVLGIFLSGISFALPLFLYLRERVLQQGNNK